MRSVDWLLWKEVTAGAQDGDECLLLNARGNMQNEIQQTSTDGGGLGDIAGFFKRNRKPIALCGLAGMLLSVIYVVLTPNSYEAQWELQMAQFVSSNDKNISVNNSEDPAALVHRLRAPTVFRLEVRESCGIHEDGNYRDYLNGVLKVAVVKSVPNIVEMKVRASSPDQANKCAEAVTAMVAAHQNSLIEEYLSGRKWQLTEYQRTLAEEQRQLNSLKKTEIGNFGYLAKLDKLSWLQARIDALQEEINLTRLHPTKLIASIYVPNKPVSPKPALVLPLGTVLGLILGVLYSSGREWWRKTA